VHVLAARVDAAEHRERAGVLDTMATLIGRLRDAAGRCHRCQHLVPSARNRRKAVAVERGGAGGESALARLRRVGDQPTQRGGEDVESGGDDTPASAAPPVDVVVASAITGSPRCHGLEQRQADRGPAESGAGYTRRRQSPVQRGCGRSSMP